MLLFNPLKNDRRYADPKTRELMQKVIGFFEAKGLGRTSACLHSL